MRTKRPEKPKVITKESLLECYNFNTHTGLWTDKNGKNVIKTYNDKQFLMFSDNKLLLAIVNYLMYFEEYVDYNTTSHTVVFEGGGYGKENLRKVFVSKSKPKTEEKEQKELKDSMLVFFHHAVKRATI